MRTRGTSKKWLEGLAPGARQPDPARHSLVHPPPRYISSELVDDALLVASIALLPSRCHSERRQLERDLKLPSSPRKSPLALLPSPPSRLLPPTHATLHYLSPLMATCQHAHYTSRDENLGFALPLILYLVACVPALKSERIEDVVD